MGGKKQHVGESYFIVVYSLLHVGVCLSVERQMTDAVKMNLCLMLPSVMLSYWLMEVTWSAGSPKDKLKRPGFAVCVCVSHFRWYTQTQLHVVCRVCVHLHLQLSGIVCLWDLQATESITAAFSADLCGQPPSLILILRFDVHLFSLSHAPSATFLHANELNEGPQFNHFMSVNVYCCILLWLYFILLILWFVFILLQMQQDCFPNAVNEQLQIVNL